MQNNFTLLKNYKTVISQIERYNAEYNRESKLLLVSKNIQKAQLQYVVKNTSQLLFGENRVQDAIDKWIDIKNINTKIRLHFLGKLQSNKVRKAVSIFDTIETVDSTKLAYLIINEASKINRKIQIFLQINIGNELGQNGITVQNFDRTFKEISDITNISGIMCILPKNTLAFFNSALMYCIAKEYKVNKLSMGMSSDFRTAIKFGATHVRIGTLIAH